MAIVLSKKKESSGRVALRKVARFIVGRYGVGAAMTMGGLAAFGLGSLAGEATETIVPVIHAAPVSSPGQGGEASRLSRVSRTLVAAVLAHQREKGHPPESLDLLFPVYLDEAPDPAWTLDGQSVRRLVEDQGVCEALGVEDADDSPAIDSGGAGLQCFRTLEGKMFAHRLIEEPVLAPERVQVVVQGRLEDRLLTWAIRSEDAGTGVACEPLPVSTPSAQDIRIVSLEHGFEARYCIPVFEGELEPIHRVMSLTQGEGALVVTGRSLGREWSLQVSAALCSEDVAQAAVRIGLGAQSAVPVQCAR